MTMDQHVAPPKASADSDVVPCRSPKLTVALMCATVAIVYGSGTILFTALSTVADELDASQTQLQWVTGTYPLVIAALLLPGGAFVDRLGRKTGAVLGLGLTAAFFLAASFANDASTVILFMGLAGIGGAMAFPATLATITAVVPKEQRGPAVGMWAASLFIGGITGTTMGGLLSEWLAWQWLLIGPAVLGLLLTVPILFLVPESRDVRNSHVDFLGAALSILAVGLFVYGMNEAPTRGLTDPLTQLALLGLIFGVLFVWWQLKAERPMLDVRLFRDGRFGSGSLVNLLSWFMTYGFFFTAVQYRYYTLGFGPLKTGLSFAPCSVFIIPLAMAGPRLARKYGARPVMVVGLLILGIGSAGIAAAATTEKFWPVAAAEAFAFAGLALVGGPATESIIDALPPAKHGVASAVNDITRQLGIALGVAMLGSLFNAAYRANVSTDGVPDDVVDATKDSAAQGLALAANLPDDVRASQTDAIAHAAALGFIAASIALALSLFVGAAVVWRRCPADAGKAVAPPVAPAVSPAITLDPVLDLPSAPVAAMAAVGPPAEPPVVPPFPTIAPPVPLGLQLVEAAERYARLLDEAQARHDELELRIARLELHEADLRRRCAEFHRAEALLFARDPIAEPTPEMST